MSLVHPYFYRTGHANDDESFTITQPLSRGGVTAGHKIGSRVGPLDYCRHRMDDYFNALTEGGWLIKEVRDWFIDMDDYRENCGAKTTEVRRTGHVPLYLFIECARM